jgi:hypothetical protein
MSKLRYLLLPSITIGETLMMMHAVSNSLWFQQLWWAYRYP